MASITFNVGDFVRRTGSSFNGVNRGYCYVVSDTRLINYEHEVKLEDCGNVWYLAHRFELVSFAKKRRISKEDLKNFKNYVLRNIAASGAVVNNTV